MAIPTYATALSQINTFIVANGNNEITANVLNPVLKVILDFANNNIGDLSTLTTDETDTIVEAINSLKANFEDLVNNGVQLHTGYNDPNVTPPADYNYGDFYMQLDSGDDSPIKLWQWNGFEWKDSSSNPATDSDNVENNSSVDGVTVTEALDNLNESKEDVSNKQDSLEPDPTHELYPTVEAVRTQKVFQDIASFSAFSGLGLNKANSSIVAIGDSNLEGYNTVNVGSGNWFNIVAKDIQKYQGPESGIGFTNLSDLTRYGVTSTGTTSVVASGPTNTAIQMTPNSTLEFTSATNFVDFWMNMTATSGKIELYYNNVLYRTIDAYNSTTLNNQYTFNGTGTPSVVSGNYKLKCINANVVITALFTKILNSNPFDSYFFLRDGVSAKSFANFNIANIKATNGLGGSSSNSTLYLLNLGTNSIYNIPTGTTSVQYGIELTNYINGLRDVNKNVVYIMPPRSLETIYPPAFEPYMNYYTVAIAVCKELGVEMIDLNDLNLYGTLSTFFEADGLHYSTAGHAMIANIVINSLAKIDVNSRNLLQQYKTDYPVPVMTGTTHYIPKRTGTNTYGNSGIYDNGTEIATDKTTRIPANIGFQWGTPTSTNFIQSYFDGTTKELKFTNSTGGVFMTLKESNGRVTFGSNITIPDGILSTDAATKGQLDASFASGNFTPTLTAGTNITSLVLNSATYSKVGNIVTARISVGFSTTSASVPSNFVFTLPINKTTTNIVEIGSGNSVTAGSSSGSVNALTQASTSNVSATFISGSGSGTGGKATVFIQYSVLD